MKFYVLVPEVAGRLGSETIYIDEIARPPIITKLHYEFEGWLGDPIVSSLCCYIITEALRDRILAVHPTGVEFGEAEVSKSEEFIERHPNSELPSFVWLQVKGIAGQDDFGYTTSNGHCIVVSARILDVLRELGIAYCEVAEIEQWKGAKAATLDKIRRFKLSHPRSS